MRPQPQPRPTAAQAVLLLLLLLCECGFSSLAASLAAIVVVCVVVTLLRSRFVEFAFFGASPPRLIASPGALRRFWLPLFLWESPRRMGRGGSAEVVVEATDVLKPRTDTRDYRCVRLGNALQALIISDPETDKVPKLCTGNWARPFSQLQFHFKLVFPEVCPTLCSRSFYF